MGITNMGQSLHSVDKHSKFVSLFLFTKLPKFDRRYQEDNLYYDGLEFLTLVQPGNAPKSAFL